ncbi:MAG: ester cyclase [Thermomicrobiales bacterium]
MSADNTAIARRIFAEVFNANAADRMDDFASPDLIVNYAGSEAPLRGLASYKELFTQDLPSFPDAHYTIDDLFGAGDKVAIRWRMDATHQGTYQGIAPTGKRVSLTGMSVYRFDGGKVAEAWVVTDSLSFMQQLGTA